MSTRRADSRGFTLTELLVAMGMTALIATILLAAAQVHTTLQRFEQEKQAAQDNVRSAIEEMSNNVRLAGTPFISRVAWNAVPGGGVQIFPAINVRNSSTGPDVLQLILYDNSTPVQTLLSSFTAVQSNGVNQLITDAPAGPPAPNLKVGDFIVLGDFRNAILYQLTANPAATVYKTVPALSLSVTPPPAPSTIGFFGLASNVTRARLIAYGIDTTIFTGTPVLTLQEPALPPPGPAPTPPLAPPFPQPQIVAENIEDLQVAVGIDFDGNGRLDEVGQAANDDEWVLNYPGETLFMPPPAGAQVLAIRISVAARSSSPDTPAGTGTGRPALEDHPAGPPDGYRWRVLSAYISLRSMETN